MRGRKPIPQEIRDATGVRSHKAKNLDAPKAPPGTPDPPKHLSKAARKIWDERVRQLSEMNVLSPVHADLLAIYCEAVADEAEAKQLIAKEGPYMETPFGFKAHPAVKVRRDAAQLAAKIAVEFGLTPSSQTRASKAKAPAQDGDEAENPALRLLKRASSAG